ncbi:hypothetical protein GmRootV77_65180 [Variovorax sp. V77]
MKVYGGARGFPMAPAVRIFEASRSQAALPQTKRRNHSMKQRHRPTVRVVGTDGAEGLQPRPRTLTPYIQELAQS